MPYIGRDIMKQWEQQYKYLWRVQQEHGRLRFDQQRQWDFLAPIFEGGDSGSNPDDGTSRIGQEHVG
ncbi:hypothetical protein SEA_LUCKYSOCKE_115 [Streptomyces phage LuckySocke]|jgi:hypothetical protein|nr:hypothetical protein SEA_ALONE_119 [Streptomyces phage Alone3]WPH58953.1 hypothetical protein SEA_LUCKYSOCKE_115 [Streptomyces phage LuckySocke]